MAAGIEAWEALGLPPWLATACVSMGMSTPTPVQAACIPVALHSPSQSTHATNPSPLSLRSDIAAAAPTGSGKTAAFALPILSQLVRDPYGVFAVVMTPARELAMQIAECFAAFGSSIPGFKLVCVTGGQDMVRQATALAGRPHIVIATPGRLADHLRTSGEIAGIFSRSRFVVLDEADRLLDNEGLRRDVLAIMRAVPAFRLRVDSAAETSIDSDTSAHSVSNAKASVALLPRLLLFSATLSKDVSSLRDVGVVDPFVFATEDKTVEMVRSLTHEYLFMADRVKDCYLTYIMRLEELDDDDSDDADPSEARSRGRGKDAKRRSASAKKRAARKSTRLRTTIIVFTSTCRSSQLIHEMLKRLGIMSVALHSELPMRDRLRAIEAFKGGAVQVLVATDVAGRGLDIPSVGLVINYNVPRDPADYVHRVGRTARAGRSGRALTLISQYDVKYVAAIEETIGKKIELLETDEDTVLRHLTETTTARTLASVELADKQFGERKAGWARKHEASARASKRLKSERKRRSANEESPGV